MLQVLQAGAHEVPFLEARGRHPVMSKAGLPEVVSGYGTVNLDKRFWRALKDSKFNTKVIT